MARGGLDCRGLPRAFVLLASQPGLGAPAGQAARTHGVRRGRYAWQLQAAGNTFVPTSAASCLAASIAVGLRWVASPSALVVHFCRTFAARERAALCTGHYSDGTTTGAHVECSGKWREQHVQEQEVWLERSQLGHEL